MEPNSLPTLENMSLFAEYKDLLLVLAGGFCAAFGGFVSTWYLAKKARQIKFAETIGVQQVETSKKALALISELNTILLQGGLQEGHTFMNENQTWFIDSVILLPPKFVEYWISMRSNLDLATDKVADIPGLEGEKKQKLIDEKKKLKNDITDLGKKALREVEKMVGLPEAKVKLLKGLKGTDN